MANEMVSSFIIADAEVDFMIHGLVKYHLFGQELWITTTHVCVLIVMAVLVGVAFAANRAMKKAKEIPTGFQNAIEMVVEMLDGVVHSSMGKNAHKFTNYVGTIFLFILLSNISGLFGLRPPTADYGMTLALGLITFGIVQFNNIKHNKGEAFTGLFKPLPVLFPINLIGEIAAPFSLSLRLFGNILSGTVIIALFYGLLPLLVKLGIPAALHVYFDLFSGAIQAYVFCMLTMVYIGDKLPD